MMIKTVGFLGELNYILKGILTYAQMVVLYHLDVGTSDHFPNQC